MNQTKIGMKVLLDKALVDKGIWHRSNPLRLHLGCGEQYLKDYINIDYPSEHHKIMRPAVDFEADITKLSCSDGVVDEIRLHHVFGYFNRVQALKLLINWQRWLRIGGRLNIETPDLIGNAKILLSNVDPKIRTGIVRHLVGDQADFWAYHVDQWYEERFRNTLGRLGFKVISVRNWNWQHKPYLANVEVIAEKSVERRLEEQLSIAVDLLRDSMVADSEDAVHQVWVNQLMELFEDCLNGRSSVSSSQANSPNLNQTIVVKMMGGLGNQMFQFATGLALARSRSATLKLDLTFLSNTLSSPVFTQRDFGLNVFELVPDCEAIPGLPNTNDQVLNKYIERSLKFDPGIFDLIGNIYLDGYWQSPKYFDFIKDEIKKAFRLTTEINTSKHSIIKDIKSNIAVALHVRRGDYVAIAHTRAVHGLCSEYYYRMASEILIKQFPDAHFYIFSDDPEWCRSADLVGYAPHTIVSDGGSVEEDFYLMSLCRHFVIANSSLSWWAAYLGDDEHKIVIAPEPWFDDPTLDADDMIPKNWIRLCKSPGSQFFDSQELPKVSVVIPCYKQAQYIEEALDSLLAQSYRNWECIIIDDGSPDNTVEVVKKYIERNPGYIIKLLQVENRGVSASKNRAIAASKGEFILPLDADDKVAPKFLETMVGVLLSYPEISIAYCDRQDFGLSQKRVNAIDFDFNHLIQNNILSNSSLYRRKVWLDAGGYDENLVSHEDWEFWISAAKHGHRGLRIPDALIFYRVKENSLYTEALKRDELLRAQIICNHQELYSPEQIAKARNIYLDFDIKRDRVISCDIPRSNIETVEQLNILEDKCPLISVIVPTCNRAYMLKDALQSIKKQTYDNWEVIVVNEGQEDVRTEVEAIIGQGRYRYIQHRSSFGLSAARNTGLRLCSGAIICFLDDDDLFLPQHLQTVVDALVGTARPVVYTDADIVMEEVNDEQRVVKTHSNPYAHDDFSAQRLIVQNYIPVNTWVCRWECFQKVGFFDETLKSFEDWDVLLRLLRHYSFLHIPQITVEVRRRLGKDDHMTDRERHTFPQLYRKIYERTRDLENDAIRIQRQKYLDQLEGKEVLHTLNVPRTRNVPLEVDPYKAWQKKHALVEADGQILAERMHTWNVSPNFLILIIFETTNTALLADTIDSLTRQFYNQWSLAIVSVMSSPDPLFDEMEMVHWLQVDDDPYQAINHVLSNVDAFDWVAVIPPGAVLSENALSVVSNYINKKPEWCFIYSDEDSIDANGAFIDPLFKPDFNLDLLRSMSYLGDACFVRKSVIDEFGGYCGLAGVLNWDLSLKVYEKLGANFIGHVPEVLLHKPKSVVSDIENKYLVAAEKLTLQRHFERLGVQVAVAEGLVDHTYFVEYPLISQPLVSVVLTMLAKEQLNRLSECVQALAKNTSYNNYEVVITSVFPEQEIRSIIDKLDVINIKIDYISYQGDSVSPLNNNALHGLNGDYILLFNPDLLVLHNYWLETLMAQALRKEVGIVGARIIDKNKQVHHAGIVLGMGDLGVADYPNRHLAMSDSGYMNRAVVTQNFSAVSTQCFLIKKTLLVDCLEADSNVFDHIDFCLKVIQRGYSIVWTPFVTLMLTQQTLQQRTMDQLRQDADQMIEKWLPQLANDPAYNRNLSLKHRHFQIETETDVTWNVDFHDRPRIYAFPANDSGIGEYRVRAPLRALTHAAMIESSLLPNHSATLIPDIVEIERVKPDTLLLQNGTADYLIHAWQQYRRFNDVFMIYSQDDLVHMLPGKHPLQSKWPKDVRRRLNQLMSHSDRLIVATEPLQEAYSKYISDIKLVPNYLEKARWLDLKPSKQSRNGKKLRVGWAGGGQHHGDLEFIAPVIEATKDEVDWIFMGMCLDQIRPFIKEYHAGVAFDLYPQKLADLDLDLAIAPLEYNNFNMAKTNLRLLEYGVLGWPVLCSDITPYKNAPVTLVGNNVNHWVKAIREKIREPEALIKEGQALQQWVFDNYWLEDHLDQWLDALTP